LVFQGVSRNLTPIATIVISFFWTGERFKSVDIIFTIVSLIGVVAIIWGF
jgi:drug/metabolite transporter (DMT)-like permease